MPIRRLAISLKRTEAMYVNRVSIGRGNLVYVIVADKKLNYDSGRSKIVYIGTTKNGLNRVAQSAATRAEQILRLTGVKSFHARIVTCRSRRHVKTWQKLERAMLLTFREQFGEIPFCNKNGQQMKEMDEFDYFARRRIQQVIDDLS